MATITIDAHSKTMFLENVHTKAQQIVSRMKKYVKMINVQGKQTAYDSLGAVEAQEVSGRFASVDFTHPEHSRRKIPRRRFYVAIPIDDKDANDIMRDPESEYVTAVVRAIERVYDRIAIEAAFATISTGEDFSTSVTAANDGVETLDATGGLTYDFLNELRARFINNDVGTDIPESFFLAITGDEHKALLSDFRTVGYDAAGLTYNTRGNGAFTATSWEVAPNSLVNSDFSTREGIIQSGVLQNAAGFDIVAFGANAPNPVLQTVDTTQDHRRCVAASTRGIVVGLNSGTETDVEDRPDLIQTKQVIAVIILGAVRTEGKLVQELQTLWDATA